ncbi:MAG: phosphoserine phosphatase, partial [bacterium]|nr:phosphoserine phosphatase [bacterium]
MDADRRTLLITLTGNDRPGVTKRLFSSLEQFRVNVLDIEQLVVRGRLILAVLLEVTGDDSAMATVRTAMRRAAADLDMDIETVPGAAEDDERRRNRIHVTVLG